MTPGGMEPLGGMPPGGMLPGGTPPEGIAPCPAGIGVGALMSISIADSAESSIE